MNSKPALAHTQTRESFATETLDAPQWQLVLWNDDVNTFDWVIETLMDVCGHSYEQAEQCALIIHHKGKYAVKEGGYETLKLMCEHILERGISATVECTVH